VFSVTEEADQAPIDPRGDAYVYQVIADRIARRIASGELAPGMPLPSEPALAEWYGVSRASVRRAREVLAGRGLVHVVAGKGTYVTRPGHNPTT
jgi:DNA-binding GntR family transcriptional regulator